MTNKKIEAPFGHIGQREWQALLARGAKVGHVAVFVLLRVRADKDGVCRDNVPTLATWTHSSEDTVERRLKWLRKAGVIAQRKIPAKNGPKGLTWLYERTSLPVDEWTEAAKTPTPSVVMEAAKTPYEDRKSDRSGPQPLGDNPRRTPEKPQTAGSALSSRVLEGSEQELATLSRCEQILGDSQHSGAFAGKSGDLLGLIKKFPDRDVEQACEDLVDNVSLIRYDSKALTLLETFIEKAPRVQPPDPEFYCSACDTHWNMNADRCKRLGIGSRPGDQCDGSERGLTASDISRRRDEAIWRQSRALTFDELAIAHPEGWIG